jgi:uncharacterized membrane protein YeaQ/YmgE (transglycosylase-associated protein family)
MNALTEVFPFLCGAVLGLVCTRIGSPALRYTTGAVLSVLLGFAAAYLSGEYLNSWAYGILDTLWVAGFALAVALTSRAFESAKGKPGS